MPDSFALQVISTAAIVIFGSVQFGFALWVVRRDWRSSDEAQKLHDSTITMAREIHASTTETLNEQRKESERQHQETMAAFEERRKDAERQHQEAMAALEGQRQATWATAGSTVPTSARELYESSMREGAAVPFLIFPSR